MFKETKKDKEDEKKKKKKKQKTRLTSGHSDDSSAQSTINKKADDKKVGMTFDHLIRTYSSCTIQDFPCIFSFRHPRTMNSKKRLCVE